MAGRITIIFMYLILLNACQKDSGDHEERRTRVPLSHDALEWIDEKEDTFSIRSSNGLSDFYKVGSYHSYPRTTINGEVVYGEEIVKSMASSLNGVDFRFVISNVCDRECFEISYQRFNTVESHLVTQKFLTTPPYTPIYFHYVPLETNAQILGLRYVGDTAINNVNYKDVFIDRISHGDYKDRNAVKTIFISKSIGLVGFVTQDDISWYRF